MDQSKIRFGDKFFLYGQFLKNLYEFNDYEYNAVLGYMTTGGFLVSPRETDVIAASVPGFVVDFLSDPSLATVATPFDRMEMIDVTDKLARTSPLPFGTKIWMPTYPTP